MLGLIAATALAAAGLPAPSFVEATCADSTLAGKARCGTVVVPEDRSLAGGRQIALSVIVLPAAGTETLPPLYDIDGGPGLASSKNAGFYLTDGAAYRASRAIVHIDQRGTGRSNGLYCPELDAVTEGPMLPAHAVQACRKRLEKQASLDMYGTRDAVADLDSVRRALGHDRIDVFALSYGTTVALRAMATYPGLVRAAVLMGTAPPFAMPPRFHAQAAQRTLDLIVADCAADADCSARFDVKADLAQALRMIAEPQARDLFVEHVRQQLYAPFAARRVPLILNQAAKGEYAIPKKAPGIPVADGMFLSVTCGESFRFLDLQQSRAEAAATIFGDYRLRRQHEACSHWPGARVSADHLAEPQLDSSVLFISGGRDPVTPPEWADRAMRQFPRSKHWVIAQSGHIIDGLSNIAECLDPQVVAFLETGDPLAVQTACGADMKPPPFATQ